MITLGFSSDTRHQKRSLAGLNEYLGNEVTEKKSELAPKVRFLEMPLYKFMFIGLLLTLMGTQVANAQFLLQAPNSTDEHNYKWYEASDRATILGTEFFYEVTQPGIYFATYDGTLCGHNATGYFIVTNCNAPYNEVTLDISASVPAGATINWSPAVSGDPLRPQVTATPSVTKYTATLTKVGNSMSLPNFTVVCMDQSANLVDDLATVDEDDSIIVPVFDNDSDLPILGSLTTSIPSNGSITINEQGTPNDPTDDLVTYTPNPDYNGPDSFTYTVCNTFGDCSTATVNVTVLPIVDALDDAVATIESQPLDIDVLANDNDLSADDKLTTTDPSNGTIVINDNGTPLDITDDTITYTADNGFIGTDTFTYTLCDTNGNCSTATVTVVVNPNGIVDSDGDGILDSFEDLNLDNDGDPSTNPTDSDGDGVPDYLDIDSDNDGIPDNVEAQTSQDYIPPSGVDANNNGLDDAYEQDGDFGLFPIDSDGDNLPDYLDEDSDGDGVPDAIEAHDHNHDGIPDVVALGTDQDNDGLDDGYEGSSVNDVDVNDELDNPFASLPNTDGDDESDYRDTDDDGDGILARDEDLNGDGNYANDDSDGDGIPDYLDPDANPAPPSDGVEVFNVVTPNGDGIHDVLTIAGLDKFPNNRIRIYNRWGVLVYSTKAYNNHSNYFDGTSEGRVTVDKDHKLPAGTYFYILEYGNEEVSKKISGYIYINR